MAPGSSTGRVRNGGQSEPKELLLCPDQTLKSRKIYLNIYMLLFSLQIIFKNERYRETARKRKENPAHSRDGPLGRLTSRHMQ